MYQKENLHFITVRVGIRVNKVNKNLVDKLKSIGLNNNSTIPSNFILQSITSRKAKESQDIQESLNTTQKTNTNTIQDPSHYDINTRESSHLDKSKVISRKQKLQKESRKFSKEPEVTGDSKSKSHKKLSLSESATKITARGSVTNRILLTAKNNEKEEKKSIDMSGALEKSHTMSNVVSPEDSNPQQPSCPKKTWPMKPGY